MADILVNAGGNLQAAINAAAGGDVIKLEAGATFPGTVTLPAKASTVTLTTNTVLPSRRIAPGDALATLAPTVVNAPAIDGPDATHWRLDGLAFAPNPGSTDASIRLQRAASIYMDRLRLEVPSGVTQKRGILGNGTTITLTRSYLAGIHLPGVDSQAFAAWSGAGPYTLTDNYLDAASENVLFGGADAASSADDPADILVEGNFITKTAAWRLVAGTNASAQVKNLLELKNARRVVIRNNILEQCYVDAQDGHALLLTPRNQDGTNPTARVYDVLIERNILRAVAHGFKISGYDNNHPSEQTDLIVLRHNLVLADGGRFATVMQEVGTLTIDHHTFVNSQPSGHAMLLLAAEGTVKASDGSDRVPQFAVSAFTFQNFLGDGGAFGIHAAVGSGLAALTAMVDGALTVRRNVLASDHLPGSIVYPPDTTFIPRAELSQHLGTDYRLVSGSVFNDAGTDGLDIGWTGQTATPGPAPTPTPDPDPFPDPDPNPPVLDPTLVGFTLTPASIVGGNTLVGTATLDKAAPTGGWLLQVGNAGPVVVPPTVLVPAGLTQVSFPVTSVEVLSDTPVVVAVERNGVNLSASATLTPVPASPAPTPTLDSLTVTPASVVGGGSATGLVVLSGPAPTGGLVVALSDAGGLETTVPANITVPAGHAAASFTLTSVAVLVDTVVTVSATLGVNVRQDTLTVLAAAPAPTPTPDPGPQPSPTPVQVVATVTIQRRGTSKNFRVRAVPTAGTVVQRTEFYVDGVMVATLTVPNASGNTYQVNLALATLTSVIEVRMYA